MSIETLDDWNQVLANGAPLIGACGCCQMPACPVPDLICGSAEVVVAETLVLPFESPVPDDEDELPRLYTSAEVTSNTYQSGTTWNYIMQFEGGFPPDPHEQYEELIVTTCTENPLGGTSFGHTSDANRWNSTTLACGSVTPIYNVYFDPTFPTWVDVSEGFQCTETRAIYEIVQEAIEGGGPLALHGCPGPFAPGDENTSAQAWDLQLIEYAGYDLVGPVTKEDMRDTAETGFVEGIYPGTECKSSWYFTHKLFEAEDGWPTRGSVSDIKNWFVCDDSVYTLPVWCYLQKWRYRWGVPDDFDGSYFKITWDILEEPFGWDRTINDPGETLPDPLPEGYDTPEEWWADHQVPDPDAPDRTFFSEDNTWEWAGPGDPEDADSWLSEWYEIDPPDVPGERRVVNIRYECYRSPYGQKPQVTGEAVTLPDP